MHNESLAPRRSPATTAAAPQRRTWRAWLRAQAQNHAAVSLELCDLQRELERERELADRHGRRFALIVFPSLSTAEDQARATQLFRRLRATDRVGVLADGRVGGLLPETCGPDALRVAHELETAAELRGAARVFVYPVETGAALDAKLADARELLDARSSRGKRALDIAGSALALAALSPLLLGIALAIKLDSRGPVLYRQARAGRHGAPFDFWKFRSMVIDADARRAELEALNEASGPVFKMRRDPRVTRVGAVLRKYSLDELPQLWNVLRGDMSLVGPRPPRVEEVERYEPWQRRRLELVGGLTCIWQVSGRSQIGFVDWVRMDLRYARIRSAWVDALILLRTIPTVLTGRGAY